MFPNVLAEVFALCNVIRRQMEDMGKNGKMAPVYPILIIQQTKCEKNGFRSPKDNSFGFLKNFWLSMKLKDFVENESKTKGN